MAVELILADMRKDPLKEIFGRCNSEFSSAKIYPDKSDQVSSALRWSYALYDKVISLDSESTGTLNPSGPITSSDIEKSAFIQQLKSIDPVAVASSGIVDDILARANQRSTSITLLTPLTPDELDLNDPEFKLTIFNKFCNSLVPRPDFLSSGIGSGHPLGSAQSLLMGISTPKDRILCLAGGNDSLVKKINSITSEVQSSHKILVPNLATALKGGNHILNTMQDKDNQKELYYKGKRLPFAPSDDPAKEQKFLGQDWLKTTSAVVAAGALTASFVFTPFVPTLFALFGSTAATCATGIIGGVAAKIFHAKFRDDPHDFTKRIADRRFWCFGKNKILTATANVLSITAAVGLGFLVASSSGILAGLALSAAIVQMPWRKYKERIGEMLESSETKALRKDIDDTGFEMEKASDEVFLNFGKSQQVIRAMLGDEIDEWVVRGVMESLDDQNLLRSHKEDFLINLSSNDLDKEIDRALCFIHKETGRRICSEAKDYLERAGVLTSDADYKKFYARYLNIRLLSERDKLKVTITESAARVAKDKKFSEIFVLKCLTAALRIPPELREHVKDKDSVSSLRADQMTLQNVFYSFRNTYFVPFLKIYAKQNSAMVNFLSDPDAYLVLLNQMDQNRPGMFGNGHSPLYGLGDSSVLHALFSMIKFMELSERIETNSDIGKNVLATAEHRRLRQHVAKWSPIGEGMFGGGVFGLEAQNHTITNAAFKNEFWRTLQQFKDMATEDLAYQEVVPVIKSAAALTEKMAQFCQEMLPALQMLQKDTNLSENIVKQFASYFGFKNTGNTDEILNSIISFVKNEKYEKLRNQKPKIKQYISETTAPSYNLNKWSYCGSASISNIEDFSKQIGMSTTHESVLDLSVVSASKAEINQRPTQRVLGYTKNGIVFESSKGQYELVLLNKIKSKAYEDQLSAYNAEVNRQIDGVEADLGSIASALTRVQSTLSDSARAVRDYRQGNFSTSNDLDNHADPFTRWATMQGSDSVPLDVGKWFMSALDKTRKSPQHKNEGFNPRTMNPEKNSISSDQFLEELAVSYKMVASLG